MHYYILFYLQYQYELFGDNENLCVVFLMVRIVDKKDLRQHNFIT